MHPEDEARDVASMIPKHNTALCKLQIYHPLLIQCISWVMLRINAIALLTDYGDLTKGKGKSQEGIIIIDNPLSLFSNWGHWGSKKCYFCLRWRRRCFRKIFLICRNFAESSLGKPWIDGSASVNKISAARTAQLEQIKDAMKGDKRLFWLLALFCWKQSLC